MNKHKQKYAKENYIRKYLRLDGILNSYWDSLPKNMQEELKQFYDN